MESTTSLIFFDRVHRDSPISSGFPVEINLLGLKAHPKHLQSQCEFFSSSISSTSMT